MATTRVLLYSHDSFGLGHYRRTVTLAHSLVAASPTVSVLCITGSPRPDLFELPPRADYVKLPSVTKDQNGTYVSRDLPSHLSKVIRIRSDAILSVCRSFRPDVFLVDHSPLGVGGELLPALRELRHRSPNTRIVLGMRDILDVPQRARRELRDRDTWHALHHLYDEILVYGHPGVFDVVAEYDLPPTLDVKISYVGWVCHLPGAAPEADSFSQRKGPLSRGRLLVSAGGGADGSILFRSVIAYLKSPAASRISQATVIAGPLMDPREREVLQDETAGDSRVEFLGATPSMDSHLKASDVVVTMGGYNSVYEALTLGKRMIVVPRSHPRREQEERARRLASLGLLAAVDPVEFKEPGAFGRRVDAALDGDVKDPREIGYHFDGAQVAAEILLDEAASSSLPPAAVSGIPAAHRNDRSK